MSNGEKAFNVAIRIVFIFAFGAFLWASLHHIAAFFHNFESDGTDWTGSYALALSIDGTALMLTIGMMFFSKNKPAIIKVLVWLFIVALTAFSWAVNWEYAKRFQSLDLTGDPFFLWLNPILASSFALLNLAYSIVVELFGSEVKTVVQLQSEIDAIDARSGLENELKKRQGPGLIQQAKEKAIEVKKAAKEVLHNDEKIVTTVPPLAAENTPLPETVFAQVAVPQIGSASDLTHEQQRTLSERITERISEQIPNDDQTRERTRERTIAEQIPNDGANDGANDSFGEQFVQSERNTEHAANQIVRFQSDDDRTNTERWSEQEPSTEPLFVPNESPNESFARSEHAANQIVRFPSRKERPVSKPTITDMTKKVQAILKKNPNAGPTFIAQKLDISKGYASELKTRVTAS